MSAEDFISDKLSDLRDPRVGSGGLLLFESSSEFGTVLIGISEVDFIRMFRPALESAATGTALLTALETINNAKVRSDPDNPGSPLVDNDLGFGPHFQRWLSEGRFTPRTGTL